MILFVAFPVTGFIHLARTISPLTRLMTSVPGSSPVDEVNRWSSDGQSLLIHAKGKVPARIQRLDLLTGNRTLVREIAPPSRAGVVNIRDISFSDDGRSYAYTFDRVLCRLAIVSALK